MTANTVNAKQVRGSRRRAFFRKRETDIGGTMKWKWPDPLAVENRSPASAAMVLRRHWLVAVRPQGSTMLIFTPRFK